MKIAVAGGGPAGLYFAMLAKRADPRHQVTVHERNRPDDTFGFGVVFSEKTMSYLREHDQPTYEEILAGSNAWDPIEVRIHGQVLSCGGIGFWAISRKRLLDILQRGAAAEGVELLFESSLLDPDEVVESHDLVAAADGVNSIFRARWEEVFKPTVEVGRTVFAWYGAALRYPSFTFLFEENEHGRFCAHIYPYEEDLSTFIIEMDHESWRRAGLEESNRAAQAPGQSDLYGLEYFQKVFAPHLQGRRLLGNNSKWASFRTVRCATWHHHNLVLMGDAAHTAHFSVGSGTKMAMEDAIALAFALRQHGTELPRVFEAYESERRPRVEGIQRAAMPSLRWYEQFRHYWSFPAERFAFHFLTRGNYDYGQLKERDPGFVARVEAAVPEVGSDLSALVITPAEISEPVAVSAESPAAVPPAGARNTLYLSQGPVAGELSGVERDGVREAFAAAAAAGIAAGYSNLLLELGRGQLLHSFLSPLTNHRTDEFGGSLENRMRYPLEVIDAVRSAWPGRLWASISATDWLPGGFTDDDAVVLGRSLKEHGVDLVVVRSGHATAASIPWYARCFNAQFSDRLRNEGACRVAVAGGILSRDDARNVLLAGRADLVLADRELF